MSTLEWLSFSNVTNQLPGDNWDLRPVFFSRIRAASDSLFLDIEEFERNLDSVRCLEDATAITLQFRTDSGFEEARNEINDFREGVAVTSHGGCNGEGERKPYKYVEQNLGLIPKHNFNS